MHVGGGRSGISTGTGPFTHYRSLQGAKPSPAASSKRVRVPADDAKAAEAERILAQLAAIDALHRHEFAGPDRMQAELPELPSFAQLLEAAEVAHLKGVRFWQRGGRREARLRARAATERHARRLLADARAAQSAQQEELDRSWRDLTENREKAVLDALETAFEDNEAPAAPVGVVDGTASVVVLVPTAESLPDRVPSTTAAGNLSLKRATKSQRAAWYREVVAGHVIAAAKESLATAPGLVGVTLVALRDEAGDVVPILAASFERQALTAVAGSTQTAWQLVEDTAMEVRVRLKGVAKEMVALDAKAASDLQGILRAFESQSE